MPIEIKELLIRAFVGDQQSDDTENEEGAAEEKTVQHTQDVLSIVSSTLKQERER
jgi:hypothetical protein